MNEGWHKQRFIARPSAVHVNCAQCGTDMWLPASKVGEYKRCGIECNAAYRRDERETRKRECKTCGSAFYPRQNQLRNGCGLYCSQKCNTAARDAILSHESAIKGKATMAEKRARGEINYRFGPDNPSWKGGAQEARLRRRDSGKEAESLRRYRRENPDKVREFTARRAGRKLGKLPYGTIPSIKTMQRNKCAICKVSIAQAYHVDHIVPLARGGQHARNNIQLLCPPCNLHKSSRDPIHHMQSLGRLL